MLKGIEAEKPSMIANCVSSRLSTHAGKQSGISLLRAKRNCCCLLDWLVVEEAIPAPDHLGGCVALAKLVSD